MTEHRSANLGRPEVLVNLRTKIPLYPYGRGGAPIVTLDLPHEHNDTPRTACALCGADRYDC